MGTLRLCNVDAKFVNWSMMGITVEIATELLSGRKTQLISQTEAVRRGVRDMRDGICCRWGSLGLEYIC